MSQDGYTFDILGAIVDSATGRGYIRYRITQDKKGNQDIRYDAIAVKGDMLVQDMAGGRAPWPGEFVEGNVLVDYSQADLRSSILTGAGVADLQTADPNGMTLLLVGRSVSDVAALGDEIHTNEEMAALVCSSVRIEIPAYECLIYE